MKKYFLLSVFYIVFHNSFAQSIYNAYAKVTAITGNTLLTVSNVNQVNHTFSVGGVVVVMQMQDDVIGTNTTNAASFGNLGAIANTGNYELGLISAVNLSGGTPTSIAIAGALGNVYNTGANSSVQLITFRKLSAGAFTSTNNISGLPWDGNIGGIVAFEVGTIFTLGHTISADYIGFAGGQKNNPNFASTSCDPNYIMAIGNKWAGKGEGIYKNTNANFAGARGKILTGGGGGNDENSGGGGGGNFSAGGIGGPGYTGGVNGCVPTVGGLGGISLAGSISASRIFMGGGGGAGHENNNVGTPGGPGGGIILLKTGTLATTGACGSISITASGSTAANAGNDGSGGGGAAGSIVLQVNSYSIANTCTLAIGANGGGGGSSNYGVAHGGGGGGGQGVIIFSGSQPTVNVVVTTTPGPGGESCTGCTGTVNGVEGGGPGNGGIIINTQGPLPIEMLYFNAESMGSKVALTWATASEKNTNYFSIERSPDAVNWTEISKVKAAENSSIKLFYQQDDPDPLVGISYYRIRTVDLDNSAQFSVIKMVNRNDKSPFLVLYPNPTSDILNIVTSGPISDVKYELFDVAGKKVDVEIQSITGNKIILDISTLSKGVYFINVKSSNANKVDKIIIK